MRPASSGSGWFVCDVQRGASLTSIGVPSACAAWAMMHATCMSVCPLPRELGPEPWRHVATYGCMAVSTRRGSHDGGSGEEHGVQMDGE